MDEKSRELEPILGDETTERQEENSKQNLGNIVKGIIAAFLWPFLVALSKICVQALENRWVIKCCICYTVLSLKKCIMRLWLGVDIGSWGRFSAFQQYAVISNWKLDYFYGVMVIFVKAVTFPNENGSISAGNRPVFNPTLVLSFTLDLTSFWKQIFNSQIPFQSG